jgi:hypothetical protein
VISGWEGTPWDLSDWDRRDRDRAEGKPGRITSSAPTGGVNNDWADHPVEPSFTNPALRLWNAVEPGIRVRLLNNVFCVECGGNTSMQLLDGRVERGDLVLGGRCVRCGGEVARVVETG